MPTYIPSASDALKHSFTGQTFYESKDIPSPSTTFIDAKFFLKPVQDEILALWEYTSTADGVPIVNKTGSDIPAGPVSITSWSVADSAFSIVADGSEVHVITPSLIADSTTGFGFKIKSFVSSIDTTGATLGDKVYLYTDGTITLTITAKKYQVVGYVASLSATGTIAGYIKAPVYLDLDFIGGGTATAADDPTASAVTQNLAIKNGSNILGYGPYSGFPTLSITDGTCRAFVSQIHSSDKLVIGTLTNDKVSIRTNNTTRFIFTEDGGAQIIPLTVATLPAVGAGMLASVTDGAAALNWGDTITGGGTSTYLVFYNGSNWTVYGK